jgi:hypothetical protein
MNFSLSMLYGGVFPFSHLIYNAHEMMTFVFYKLCEMGWC